jgi:hypothetical protein
LASRASHSRPILTFPTAVFCEMSLSECKTTDQLQVSSWQPVESEIEPFLTRRCIVC